MSSRVRPECCRYTRSLTASAPEATFPRSLRVLHDAASRPAVQRAIVPMLRCAQGGLWASSRLPRGHHRICVQPAHECIEFCPALSDSPQSFSRADFAAFHDDSVGCVDDRRFIGRRRRRARVAEGIGCLPRRHGLAVASRLGGSRFRRSGDSRSRLRCAHGSGPCHLTWWLLEPAERAGHPGIAQRPGTGTARLLQPRTARRTDEKIVVDPALAGRTRFLVFELLEECFLFQRALIDLCQRVPRTQDQVDPVPRKEEEQNKEHSDHLDNRVPSPLTNIAIGPEHQCYPEDHQIGAEDEGCKFQAGFPGTTGPAHQVRQQITLSPGQPLATV